jgi:hypothetical protein
MLQVLLATCGDRDEEKLQEDLGIKPAHMEQVRGCCQEFGV